MNLLCQVEVGDIIGPDTSSSGQLRRCRGASEATERILIRGEVDPLESGEIVPADLTTRMFFAGLAVSYH